MKHEYRVSIKTSLVYEDGKPARVLSTARDLDRAMEMAEQYHGRPFLVQGKWHDTGVLEDGINVWSCNVSEDEEGSCASRRGNTRAT